MRRQGAWRLTPYRDDANAAQLRIAALEREVARLRGEREPMSSAPAVVSLKELYGDSATRIPPWWMEVLSILFDVIVPAVVLVGILGALALLDRC